MVDIETLGVEPGCIVLSIGATRFDVDGVHDTFYRNIDMKSCSEVGLSVDVSTLQWWLEQEGEATHCLTGGDPLRDCLMDFKLFYKELDEIWANSPAFDCSVLEAAFDAIGMDEPWSYGEERCYRTLESIHGSPGIEMEGEKHNALDDAVYQSRVASEILKDL